ncbi:hypothetical protein BG003_008600 [Podila horticola]|nr:hypothetical protein BG003_008600 [Podila horticola]
MVHFAGSDIVLFVIVLLKKGCGCEFLISVGTTLLGYVPGVLYAWYIVYQNRIELQHPNPNHHHRFLHGDRRGYQAVPSGNTTVQGGVVTSTSTSGSPPTSNTTEHTTTTQGAPQTTTTSRQEGNRIIYTTTTTTPVRTTTTRTTSSQQQQQQQQQVAAQDKN